MTQNAYRHGPVLLIGTALLACVVLAGVFAFVLKDQMLVHYHANRLAQTDDNQNAANWLQKHHLLAIPVVVPYLRSTDPKVCQRCGDFLRDLLTQCHDPTNPSDAHVSLLVAVMLHEQSPTYSSAGYHVAVELEFQILRNHLATWSPNVATALETAGEVVLNGLRDTDPAIRQSNLERLREIWSWNGADIIAWSLVWEWKHRAYTEAVNLLADQSLEIRQRAVEAIVDAPFHEGDHVILGLIEENDATLRRTVLLALANSSLDERHISLEDMTVAQKNILIGYLHDPEPTVREATHQLLRRSNVAEADIHLASLLKHPDARERAKLPVLAMGTSDPMTWLQHLWNDPSPEVRAAVARAAAGSDRPEIRSQLNKLADSDPDPIVRQLSQQLITQKLANTLQPIER